MPSWFPRTTRTMHREPGEACARPVARAGAPRVVHDPVRPEEGHPRAAARQPHHGKPCRPGWTTPRRAAHRSASGCRGWRRVERCPSASWAYRDRPVSLDLRGDASASRRSSIDLVRTASRARVERRAAPAVSGARRWRLAESGASSTAGLGDGRRPAARPRRRLSVRRTAYGRRRGPSQGSTRRVAGRTGGPDGSVGTRSRVGLTELARRSPRPRGRRAAASRRARGHRRALLARLRRPGARCRRGRRTSRPRSRSPR